MSDIRTPIKVSKAFECYAIVQEKRVRTIYNGHRGLPQSRVYVVARIGNI